MTESHIRVVGCAIDFNKPHSVRSVPVQIKKPRRLGVWEIGAPMGLALWVILALTCCDPGSYRWQAVGRPWSRDYQVLEERNCFTL